MVRTTIAAIFMIALLPQSTCAVQLSISESVEWYINISDAVIVAEVTETKPAVSSISSAKAQKVTCTQIETLKGQSRNRITFTQEYWPLDGTKLDDKLDRALQPKDRVLLFVNTKTEGRDPAHFWLNLTKPEAKFRQHSAYNNHCECLGTAEAVLKLTKQRIAMEDPKKREKKRGVIVPFTPNENPRIRWFFVRTADPEFKPVLIKALQTRESPWDVQWAIYNLVSYPGRETVDLIRPFLKDPTFREEKKAVGKDAAGNSTWKEVKVFPTRQYAFVALKLLGESPEQPEGYDPDHYLYLFDSYFESGSLFPYGDWKRLDKK